MNKNINKEDITVYCPNCNQGVKTQYYYESIPFFRRVISLIILVVGILFTIPLVFALCIVLVGFFFVIPTLKFHFNELKILIYGKEKHTVCSNCNMLL